MKDDGPGNLFESCPNCGRPMWKCRGNCKNGEAWARHSDPETSHDAAEDVRGKRANRLESVVVATLLPVLPEGLTTHEICAITGEEWNSISPRMRPLCRKGRICDSGNRRKGPPGKYCIVWKAVRK